MNVISVFDECVISVFNERNISI